MVVNDKISISVSQALYPLNIPQGLQQKLSEWGWPNLLHYDKLCVHIGKCGQGCFNYLMDDILAFLTSSSCTKGSKISCPSSSTQSSY